MTVDVPLARLNQVDAAEFGWQVPGLREETVTELIRTLPKPLRTMFVPVPDTARAVLPELGAPHGDLLDALSAALGRLGGVPVPRSAFDESRLPAHLRFTFRVVEDGEVLATGKDLAELRGQLRPRLQATLSEAARGLTRTGLRSWDLESLPRVFAHGQVRAYPALADAGDAVDIRLFETEAEADAAMLQGTRRLLLLAVPSGARAVAGRLPVTAKLAMSRHPYPEHRRAAGGLRGGRRGPDHPGRGWPGLGRGRFRPAARSSPGTGWPRSPRTWCHGWPGCWPRRTPPRPAWPPRRAPRWPRRSRICAVSSRALVYPGFVSGVGAQRLADLARYLQAITRRLEKMPESPGRDAERMAAVHRVSEDYASVLAELPPSRRQTAATQAVRWMIEEFRVSLFAQTLGTRGSVSEQRIERALDQLRRSRPRARFRRPGR